MLTAAKFQEHCKQLIDPSNTPEARKGLVSAVRDSIELVHSQEYSSFLAHFLPTFKTVLTTLTKPQQIDNIIHQTRAIILEILNRLPHNEVLRGRFLEVFSLAMEILQKDNEENAVTAIHIIFDLHKNYRHNLGNQVQPFLDFVRRLYESFSSTVNALLLTKKPAEQSGQNSVRRMATSTQSFKVMTECPLLVMFVFQLYPKFIKTNIQRLLPLMLRAIEVEVPAQAAAVCPKATFQEFIAAQVKTVSFLAYLLKQFPDLMKPDEMSIPRSVVKLLQSCPGESVIIRKELLVATRHILGSPFRQGFFGQIDLLLEPKILVGTGRGAADTLRPLAYSFLAELVHCVRLNLTIPQLEKIIKIFSTNLHDPTFTYTLQTSAVRLLLNLIEGIMIVEDGDSSRSNAARALLLRILETMVAKYVNLGEQVPRLMKSVDELRSRPDPVSSNLRLFDVSVGDPMKEISDFKALLKTLTLGLKTLIWSAINVRVSQPGSAKGSAVGGSLDKSGGPSQPNMAQRPGIRVGLLEKECEVVSRLLTAGQSCFRLYRRSDEEDGSTFDNSSVAMQRGDDRQGEPSGFESRDPEDSVPDMFLPSPAPRFVVATAQEEKEMFEHFAQIFTVLDIRSFQDVFGLRMQDLFDHIVENPAALMIPQHFLANNSISKYFADILLNFLVDNLSIFDVAIPKSAATLSRQERVAQSFLKLFKILFASVTLFPTNEPILRLHIGKIVRRCLRHAAKARDPHNYLQMLRALFKTLTNNKSEMQFDMLYRDFMPLVEPLFTGLLALYQGPNRQAHSDLIVELCLMIPARPSTIFPYLDLQIKPIVWALEGGRENVHYGLRTLEFWVDMLQPAYFQTLISRIEPDLTRSLYRLLRPPSSISFGATALRILGKLGCRARTRSTLVTPVAGCSHMEAVQNIHLTWADGTELAVATNQLIQLSADVLLGVGRKGAGDASREHKSNAWKFLYACLSPMLGTSRLSDSGSAEGGSVTPNNVWVLSSTGSKSTADGMVVEPAAERRKVRNKEAVAKSVRHLLVALLGSSALPDLWQDNDGDHSEFWGGRTPAMCISELSRFFALLSAQAWERRCGLKKAAPENAGVSDTSPNPLLHHTLFLDAMIDALSLQDRTLCTGGLRSLEAYVDGLLDFCVLFGSNKDKVPDSPAENTKPQTRTDGSDAMMADPDKLVPAVDQAKATAVGPPSDVKKDSAQYSCKVSPEQNVSVLGKETGNVQGQTRAKQDTHGITGKAVEDGMVLAKAMAEIVERLCHCCCSRIWNAKWAGTNGLMTLVNRIPSGLLGSAEFISVDAQILRALLFVVRDSSEANEEESVRKARSVLQKLLRTCFSRKGDSPTGPMQPPFSGLLREATVRLTVDLTCESATARETARQCLKVLGEVLGCEIASILTPVKDQVLRPLQQRSIRQHPFPTQVGHMDGTIFCLQLERPIIAQDLFSMPLRNVLLSEVIAISEDSTVEKLTEAEEGIRHKLVENKLIQTAVVTHLIQLRRRAVELLSNVTVHCTTFLQEAVNDVLFRRMISSFFKNLQSRDPEIVENAKRGLKQAISKHQKPKDLLQQNLRPILGNLADYKKLSIPYLQGLSRVLELFSHWFNVNLGEKLLEHLQRWTEPEKLAQLKRWPPGTEARVGAAILDLFHLLPPAASKFLEKIVYMVIRLESVLTVAGPGVSHLGLKSAKAASTSPYREPLLKYCNRHSRAAVTFFLHNLDNDLMRQLFFVMNRATGSGALQKELMDNPKRLVSQTFLSTEGMGSKSLHIISLIDLLSRHKPEWLGADPDLIFKLSGYWKAASNFSNSSQRSESSEGRVQEVKLIALIFIRYFSHFPKEISTLFDLLPVFSIRTSCDFTFVKDFLKESVTKADLSANRRAVIVQFLSVFQEKQLSQERKVHALQYIVTPMISHHLAERKRLALHDQEKRKESAVEPNKLADTIRPEDCSGESAENALREPSKPNPGQRLDGRPAIKETGKLAPSSGNQSELTHEGSDVLRSGIDLVLDPPTLQRIMRELLDRPDDVLRKYDEPLSAELLRLATILIQYIPTELGRYRKELIKFGWNHLKREDSIAKQWAFVNVSRFFEAYQAPGKIILQVYVALLRACQGDGKELVQKALDILTPALPRRLEHNPDDHKYPIWIRYTKKILLEEGHSIPNLVHIWQLITRHPALFYVARAQFVPIMVNSLSRIGLNTNANPENRRLSLDLVDLIIRWERTRRSEGDGSRDIPGTSPGKISDSAIKKRSREESGETDRTDGSNTGSNAESITGKLQEGREPPAKTLKNSDAQSVPVSSMPNRTQVVPNREAEDFRPTLAMVDILVNFLVQIPFRPVDRREGPLISRKSAALLKEALELWPEAPIRLGFVEKLLALPASEKLGPGANAASSGKPSASPGPSDSQALETKAVGKNENQRLDKAEQTRAKRNAVRFVSLTTALGLTSVLVKAQGQRFVASNYAAIRALVVPAITENALQSAIQFASLLKDLLVVYPSGNSRSLESRNGEVPSNVEAAAPKVQPEAQMGHFYGMVHEGIQTCLKSADAATNQCGLLVLKAFSTHGSQEFVKYQEIITKSLHRMSRENLNAAHPPSAGAASGTGAGVASINRTGNTSERNTSTGGTGNSVRSAGNVVNSGADPGPSSDSRTGRLQVKEDGLQKSNESQALILCLSLLGDNILTLEAGQKKTLFHLLWALIDRCLQVDILLEIVRVVGNWVLWKPNKEKAQAPGQKEPLAAKEKVHFLLKMVVFERITGKRSQDLMNAYLSVILKIFGGEDKRPELLPKLERAFMMGMKTKDSKMRKEFFQIYNDSLSPSLSLRLAYVLTKQEWEYLADTLWTQQATEFLLAAANGTASLQADSQSPVFPIVARGSTVPELRGIAASTRPGLGRKFRTPLGSVVVDQSLTDFCSLQKSCGVAVFTQSLRALVHHDPEIAYHVWTDLFPKAWAALGSVDRCNLEKAIPQLLTKEYHQTQVSWPRNNVQVLLEGITKCEPLPLLRPELVFHLGSKWNAWHTSMRYFEKRIVLLETKGRSSGHSQDEKSNSKIRAELEDIADVQAELYRQLHERDYLAGLWKARSRSNSTATALDFEQLGQYAHAQDVYSKALEGHVSSNEGSNTFAKSEKPGKAEICLWEERWIECARNLCQWDILTEFSRVVVNSELLHECLWKVPDWSALKELLIKNPVEDGPHLKLYQAYVQLQENKLEPADSYIMQGYQRALERYCALPESPDLDASSRTLVQFQQLVELQESGRILGELNALSRHGTGSINVDQKIETVRVILNTWRERLPSQHEPLYVWNDILTWRNHVHAVVVNVLEALKEAASAKVAAAQNAPASSVAGNRTLGNGLNAQTPQVQAAAAIAQALPQQVLVMGVNETAWNVHRFAKACRKQGFPDMALFALQKLYPFGTMELTEYFVKTKETARSFMLSPKGVQNGTEYGLHELNRCNMDHFNARQKAQLFTIRGKLCANLGRDEDAVEAYSVALSTSSDVGSAWLAWGLHCDKLQEKFLNAPSVGDDKARSEDTKQNGSKMETVEASLEWREATVNCLLQAVRFGSRKSRMYLPRVLRLLTIDVQARRSFQDFRNSGTEKTEGGLTSKGAESNSQEEGIGTSSLNPNASESKPRASVEARGTGTSQDEATASHAAKWPPHEGVVRVINKLVPDIPTWMWMPWLHQIILMLSRKEAVSVRPILVRVAQEYPQALFFPIRAFMDERRGIDRPKKQLSKDALKMGRPITPALLATASAQAVQVNAARQTQTAKENAQRAQQRFLLLQKGIQRIDAALLTSQGTKDHAANLAKKAQLKEELVNAHRVMEKCMREYQVAQQRQRQATENPDAMPTSSSSLPATQRGKTQPAPSTGVQDKQNSQGNGSASAAERRKSLAGMATDQEGDSSGRVLQSGTSLSGDQDNGSDRRSGPGVVDHPFAHADFVMSQIVKSHQLLYLEMDRIAIDLSHRFKPQQEEHLLSLMNALLHKCFQCSVKPGREVAPSFRTALEEISRMCFGTGVTEAREKSNDQRPSPSIADLKEQFESELAPQVAKDFPTQLEPLIDRLRRWQQIFQRRVDAMPEFLKLENMSRALGEMKTSDIEVFGQYLNPESSEPNIEQHTKITRICADVRVIRRQSGSSRGIEIVGSDGKSYNFLLETSVNASAQATEERSAQVHRLLNSFIFAKNSEASRRLVRLTVPTFVATSGWTRLVSDDPSLSSLAEGLERFLEQRGQTPDDPLMAFRRTASEAYGRRKTGAGEQAGRSESIAARVEAYHDVCQSRVPDTCLSTWVRENMPTATRDFSFRKRVAETLAPESLVSYLLAVGARRPQNIMFSWATGTVHNIHMRGLISTRGVLESDEAVPFRLTRNLLRLLGSFGLEGPFYGAMAAAMQALLDKQELLRLFLDIVVRDELVGWVHLKSENARKGGVAASAKDSGIAQHEFQLLESRLKLSVDAALTRLLPAKETGGDNPRLRGKECTAHVADAVHRLISKSSDPENLAQMEASWQAWY